MKTRADLENAEASSGCTIALAIPLVIFGLFRLGATGTALQAGELQAAFSHGVWTFVALGLVIMMGRGRRVVDYAPGSKTPYYRVLNLMGFLLLLNYGLMVSQASLDDLRSLRSLERVNPTVVAALLPGPVNVSGRVEAVNDEQLLRSPETGTPVVYYYHLVERRSDDSWSTVSSARKYTDFYLDDETGRVLVTPEGPVRFRAELAYQQVRDRLRYSEYLIRPGDEVFVYGDLRRYDDLDELVVRFGREVDRPVVSRWSEADEREGIGGHSIAYSWLGLALISFSVVFLAGIFLWHNTVAYLAAVAFMMMMALLGQGLYMLKADLEDARDRVEVHLQTAEHELSFISGGGAVSPPERPSPVAPTRLLYQPSALLESGSNAERARRIRIDAALAVEQFNASLTRFPESRVAPRWGIAPLQTLPLNAVDAEFAATLAMARPPTRLTSPFVWFAIALGLAAGIYFAVMGLRMVRIRRMIENVPPSPTNGICYGLAALNGEAEGVDAQPLIGPLSETESCWYTYTIEEDRGSDNTKWVEIHRDTPRRSIWCRDAQGRVRVELRDAEIITNHKEVRIDGKKRYTERYILQGEPVYVLGFAGIDAKHHDRLELKRGDDKDLPFIVSTVSAPVVMYRKSRMGRWALNAGLVGMVLAGLYVFGFLGGFSPTNYLAAAGLGWAYLVVLVGVLHYNDLVFLRHRAERSWANIDVALKKRSDLVGSLVAVVRESIAHEASLLERLTTLRATASSDEHQSEGGSSLVYHPLGGQIRGLRERNPTLKSDERVTDLMRALSDLEDEIALMRSGYNDAVERLNNRVETIPDRLIAWPTGFRPRPFLLSESRAVNPVIVTA